MPLYLFVCACGSRSESLQKAGTKTVGCKCGRQAERQSVYATQIVGRAAKPRGELKLPARDYTEASEMIEYQHQRAEESAQRPLPTPPLARMAIKRAQQLMAAGVRDSSEVRSE